MASPVQTLPERIAVRYNLTERLTPHAPREITIEVTAKNQATAGAHCRMCRAAAPLHRSGCPEEG